MQSGKGEIPSNVTSINDFDDVYIVDEKGNVAYIIGDKLYGNIELAEGEKPTREDFFIFNEETGTITGIVENTTKDPNGVGWYYNEDGVMTVSEKDIIIPSTINGVPVTSVDISDFYYMYGPHGGGINYHFGITNVKIPDTVTYVGGIFACGAVPTVQWGNSVNTLYNTFAYCSNLTTMELPDTITDMTRAFYACKKLNNITIPESVTTIEYTFRQCYSLKNIYLPGSITNMECF